MTTRLPKDLQESFDAVYDRLFGKGLDPELQEQLLRAARKLRAKVERLVQGAYDYRAERDALRLIAESIADDATGVREPEEFVHQALEALQAPKGINPVERACVLLFDPDSGKPTVLHSFGIEGET